jgi:hypothetical protein
MKRHLFDRMPFRYTEFIEEPDDTVSFVTHQDAQDIVDDNKRKANAFGNKLTPGKMGEFHHAASIPFTVWEEWLKETNGAIAKDSNLLRKYLNNPDHKFLRTSPVKI